MSCDCSLIVAWHFSKNPVQLFGLREVEVSLDLGGPFIPRFRHNSFHKAGRIDQDSTEEYSSICRGPQLSALRTAELYEHYVCLCSALLFADDMTKVV